MSNYEAILSIPDTVRARFIEHGLFRPSLKRDMDVYGFYGELLLKGYTRMDALTTTSMKYKISEETVSRIIRRMR